MQPDQRELNLFSDVLRFFEITDFSKQIEQYANTYRDSFADKLMSNQELEFSLKHGFYIGHYRTGLGEFLSYTSIPRMLKKFYPDAKVYVCGHRFAESLFRRNEFVDGVVDINGREPFGTFREFGFGTHPQKRLRPFGIFATAPVSPEVPFSQDAADRWKDWRQSLPLNGRKLVFVQSSGRTNPKLFSSFKWFRLLRAMREEFYFVQVGNLRDQFIWANKILLKQWDMEEAAAALSQGDAFIGPNSGMMHFAAAVGLNAVIIHNEAMSSELFLPTLGDNIALPKKVNHHLFHVFPQHYHAVVDGFWDTQATPAPFAAKANIEQIRNLLRSACISPNPLWTQIEKKFAHPTECIFKNS